MLGLDLVNALVSRDYRLKALHVLRLSNLAM
jgi:hypothetical protein